MLTSGITKQVPIPHENGEWITIRMLSGKQLEQAREAKSRSVLASLRGNADVIKELQSVNRDEVLAKADAEGAVDPLTAYDVDTLLCFGIIDWSYPEDCTTAVSDLDGATREWAAREIIALSLRTDGDGKNSIGSSTAH